MICWELQPSTVLLPPRATLAHDHGGRTKARGKACWGTADGQQREVKEVGWRGRLAARGERRLAGWVTVDEQRGSRIDNSA